MAFDKVVVIRYTTKNGWATQDQNVANYSHRLFATDDIDIFNITISTPVKLEGKCEFLVQYQVAGEEFWDINDGQNYIVNVSQDLLNISILLATIRNGQKLNGSEVASFEVSKSSLKVQNQFDFTREFLGSLG